MPTTADTSETHRPALVQAAQLQAGVDTTDAVARHAAVLWLLWALDNPTDVRPSDVATHQPVIEAWVVHLDQVRARATSEALPARARMLSQRVGALAWALQQVTDR